MPHLENTVIKTYLLLACFILPAIIFSQAPAVPSDYVTIHEIYVEGNRRTRLPIILRELDFNIGDTIHIATLVRRLQENEYNILNTGLFTTAQFSFREWEGETNKVGLKLEVKEDWYIFPFPIVELADRNFNVWWTTYNKSLRRLNLGIRFYHLNATGRRDQLKTVIQFGFTKKYELVYNLPAFNRAQTWGTNINVLYTREKEINYTTTANKQVFNRNDEEVLLQRFRLGGGIFYRKKLDIIHRWNAAYHRHRLHRDIAVDLNPDFFLDGRKKQEYFSVDYQFSVDKRDIRPYPMTGYLLSGRLEKKGLGIIKDLRSTEAEVAIQQYFSFKKNWSLVLAAKGKTELQRHQQPFYTSRAMGYLDDFIRGYEYYVIDGLDFIYLKKALRFNIFQKEFNWGRYMKYDSFKNMPLKLFLVLHNELGYVNNPYYETGNPLSNEILWGSGIGLDVVLYYNKVFNFEFSRNHLGEYGFFLHWTFSF